MATLHPLLEIKHIFLVAGVTEMVHAMSYIVLILVRTFINLVLTFVLSFSVFFVAVLIKGFRFFSWINYDVMVCHYNPVLVI